MSVTLNSTGITYSDGTSENTRSIPTGANVVFYMVSAPTGYTQITSHHNKAMRIVSGTGGGSGGSVAFSTAFSSQSISGTIGATTLATTQIPAHNHGVSDPGHAHGGIPNSQGVGIQPGPNTWSIFGNSPGGTWGAGTGISIANNGGGQSHAHSFSSTALDLTVQYVDMIIAQRN